MRFLVVAAIFSASSAVAFENNEEAACSGWEIDRYSLETLITAQEDIRATLGEVDESHPASELSKELIGALDLILKGAHEAAAVTGEIFEKVCP